ncbi:MAG: hypothetical protein ACI9TH_000840, partial [Kiritimatiellia bacterium]
MLEKIACPHCGKKTFKLLECQKCGTKLLGGDTLLDGDPEGDATSVPALSAFEPTEASTILAEVDTILEALPEAARGSGLRVKRNVVGASNPDHPGVTSINTGEKKLFEDEEDDFLAGIEEIEDEAGVNTEAAVPSLTASAPVEAPPVAPVVRAPADPPALERAESRPTLKPSLTALKPSPSPRKKEDDDANRSHAETDEFIARAT